MTYWNNMPRWNGRLETLEDHNAFFAWLEAYYEPEEHEPDEHDEAPDPEPGKGGGW